MKPGTFHDARNPPHPPTDAPTRPTPRPLLRVRHSVARTCNDDSWATYTCRKKLSYLLSHLALPRRALDSERCRVPTVPQCFFCSLGLLSIAASSTRLFPSQSHGGLETRWASKVGSFLSGCGSGSRNTPRDGPFRVGLQVCVYVCTSSVGLHVYIRYIPPALVYMCMYDIYLRRWSTSVYVYIPPALVYKYDSSNTCTATGVSMRGT